MADRIFIAPVRVGPLDGDGNPVKQCIVTPPLPFPGNGTHDDQGITVGRAFGTGYLLGPGEGGMDDDAGDVYWGILCFNQYTVRFSATGSVDTFDGAGIILHNNFNGGTSVVWSTTTWVSGFNSGELNVDTSALGPCGGYFEFYLDHTGSGSFAASADLYDAVM